MPIVRAAEVAKRRLSIASRRLGTQDPIPVLGPLMDRTFELPLELSFSELTPGALRFDLEPLGPAASPLARRQEASREMRRLVQQHYGRPALAWFDQQSEPFRGGSIGGRAKFGAWFGAAFDEGGVNESKVYYEL